MIVRMKTVTDSLFTEYDRVFKMTRNKVKRQLTGNVIHKHMHTLWILEYLPKVTNCSIYVNFS